MNTYRDLIYIVLDKLKLTSDDARYKEEHVAYLLDKYRPLLLKQRFADIRKTISPNNYSVFTIDVEEGSGYDGSLLGNTINHTSNGKVYTSTTLMPRLVGFNDDVEEYRIFNVPQIEDNAPVLIGDFSIVSPDRFKYVGENKWLRKFNYTTIGPDYKLYVKVKDEDIQLPTTLLIQAIVEDPKKEVNRILPIVDDYLDMIYPLEEAITPLLLELVIKDLTGSIYKPEDKNNNADDDLSNMSVTKNTKE